MQGCRHRHQAVVGEDQQIAAPLQHTPLTHRSAEFPDADQRPGSVTGWIGAAIDNDFAGVGDKGQIVINAVASINRPRIQIDKIAAISGNRLQTELLCRTANGAGRQIPSLQRFLLDKPDAVLEQDDVVKIAGINAGNGNRCRNAGYG